MTRISAGPSVLLCSPNPGYLCLGTKHAHSCFGEQIINRPIGQSYDVATQLNCGAHSPCHSAAGPETHYLGEYHRKCVHGHHKIEDDKGAKLPLQDVRQEHRPCFLGSIPCQLATACTAREVPTDDSRSLNIGNIMVGR